MLCKKTNWGEPEQSDGGADFFLEDNLKKLSGKVSDQSLKRIIEGKRSKRKSLENKKRAFQRNSLPKIFA